MSENEAHVDGPPEAVWAVLKDPYLYGDWVVGTRKVVDADANWPAVDSTLSHHSGFGPLRVSDITKVLAATEPSSIKLEARLGFIGTAIVELQILADPSGGSKIVMRETFVKGLPSKLPPLTHALLKGRNVETLRRLANLAQQRTP